MITPSSRAGIVNSLRNYTTEGLIINLDFSNDYGFSGNTAYDLQSKNILYDTPAGYVAVVKGSTAMPGYIELDAVADYLVATGTAAGLAGLTSCTSDIWVYLAEPSLNQTIWSTNSNSIGVTHQGSAVFWNKDANGFRWGTNTGTITTGLAIPGLSGATGSWINCFMRAKAVGNDLNVTGISFLINGVSYSNLITGATAAGYAGGLTTNNLLTFGKRSTTAFQQPLSGRIGSVKIYNRLLTIEEILFNYNRSKTRYGHT